MVPCGFFQCFLSRNFLVLKTYRMARIVLYLLLFQFSIPANKMEIAAYFSAIPYFGRVRVGKE